MLNVNYLPKRVIVSKGGKMKIGIEDFKIDSAHYTKGISEKCSNIHGHTFKINVEIWGKEIDEKDGMVLDFGILKNKVRKILDDWDHKLILPQKIQDEVKIKGPFNLDIKTISESSATTENIAKEISKEIYDELELPVKVKIYEGENSFAVSEYTGEVSDE